MPLDINDLTFKKGEPETVGHPSSYFEVTNWKWGGGGKQRKRRNERMAGTSVKSFFGWKLEATRYLGRYVWLSWLSVVKDGLPFQPLEFTSLSSNSLHRLPFFPPYPSLRTPPKRPPFLYMDICIYQNGGPEEGRRNQTCICTTTTYRESKKQSHSREFSPQHLNR